MAIYKSDIVDIELEKGNISRNFLAHSIGMTDSSADRFGVRVFRNGTPVDLTGCSCQGFFRNADGTNIALTSYGTVDGNTAYVTLPQACYNVDGPFCLAIKLVGGGVTGTMRIVDGVVDNTNTSGAVAPTSSVPTYQEIIAQYDAMVAATAAAEAAANNGMIADAFDVATAYTAGKYVTNNGHLYRLTADHAANVSWSNTQKTQVDLGDEVTALNTGTVKNPAMAAVFDETVAYEAGQYVLYNSNLYMFPDGHEANTTWANSMKYQVTMTGEFVVEKKRTEPSLEMLVRKYGAPDGATIQLVGTQVPYRYVEGTRVNTHTSMRYTLPDNIKTVDISMYALANMNSFTFLDANDNVLYYRCETQDGQVNITGLNAWEAKYLVCSNNNNYINTIFVTATIGGVGQYIDEAKKANGEQWTLLHGVPQPYYYSDTTQGEANYSAEFTVAGYDYIEVTSFNISSVNKVTFLDSNGNVLGYFRTADQSEIGTTTTVKMAVPANAAKVWVGTYRVQRPNVIVYGIMMPEDFGWENCSGTFVDYLYTGPNYNERVNGSKEYAASQYDIFKIVNGRVANNNNAFTAFDSNNNIIGYVSLRAEEVTDETYYICPTGTAKIAIASGRAGAGWSTSASIQVMKRKTTKLMSVLGDSITTFENFVPSADYNPFYMVGNHDVSSAAETWWGRILIEKGWKLSTDNAWGGSQVAATGGDYTTSAMCNTRCQDLARGGTPDIIIILGGTNDFGHGVPIGTWAGDADLPEVETDFRAAYARMLMKIHASYPLAKVYCCSLINRETDLVPGSMEKKYGQYLTQFNTAIRQIAPMLNCTLIDLESCGLNQYNMEEYMADYHPDTGKAVHPNRDGMALMASRILEHLTRQ